MVFEAKQEGADRPPPANPGETGGVPSTGAAARLSESEARFRSLFEHASDGILLFDDQGIVGDANPRMLQMLACRLGRPLG